MPRVPFDPAADYYELLGVRPGATSEEIQTAYRRLAKAFHPMPWPGVDLLWRIAHRRLNGRRPGSHDARPPDLVVACPRIRVEQHRLGDVEAGHARRRDIGVGVQIRVERLGQTPIGRLDLLRCGARSNAEELVVVSGRVRRDARPRQTGRINRPG